MPRKRMKPVTVTPLGMEIRTHLPTSEAAVHLQRSEGTLRGWGDDGPIQPCRINGRMLWPVAEIRRVLGLVPASTEEVQP